MDFVTGGAYNGKGEWVRKTLLETVNEVTWIDVASEKISTPDTSTLVVENLEYIVKEHEPTNAFEKLEEILRWEKRRSSRMVILIGTDTTKGIVPLERSDREWRDRTGFLYQEMVKRADHAFLIWFGLGEKLK
ncbi:bifunctional adenosylcobinamide kinase/adenosylcobinamide-phosphate guanylyltransferase [Halobacillus mangrovi]|uniref:bifunctional adenosylcobinamide kinase/adenosylcobinamide-phosphate guanylyltransferase n=1 Tax=Halobacillus mangrovi TaxID=402384 RepID=UPI0018DBB542|nr:bifunctional adenosylcobinamide kinase/adenosylcobinamide-phosphate guanylyltransferase [Halobacillus mangrovi]